MSVQLNTAQNVGIMTRLAVLRLLGALTVTTASRMHGPDVQPAAVSAMPAAIDDSSGSETLEVYYSPLDSTRVARFFGLGMAYHMAIVYTDRNGVSRAASSCPSDLSAPQTPEHPLGRLRLVRRSALDVWHAGVGLS